MLSATIGGNLGRSLNIISFMEYSRLFILIGMLPRICVLPRIYILPTIGYDLRKNPKFPG